MYNAKYIIPGLLVFMGVFTAPFWLNLLSPEYVRPAQAALPADQTECVETRAYMRAEHMQILDTWRDQALREGKRTFVDANGRKWAISLQNTCMDCHSNQAKFCDECHTSNSVSPYCWDCHVSPRGNE